MAARYPVLKGIIEEELTLPWVGIEKVLYEYRRTRSIFEDIEVGFLICVAVTVVVAQGVVGEIFLHGIEEGLCYSIACRISHRGVYAIAIGLGVGEGIAVYRDIYAVLLLRVEVVSPLYALFKGYVIIRIYDIDGIDTQGLALRQHIFHYDPVADTLKILSELKCGAPLACRLVFAVDHAAMARIEEPGVFTLFHCFHFYHQLAKYRS